jgi:hypothetical protein
MTPPLGTVPSFIRDRSQIGTFTISNLGMFGIKHFAAVILPPQVRRNLHPHHRRNSTPRRRPKGGKIRDILTVIILSFY